MGTWVPLNFAFFSSNSLLLFLLSPFRPLSWFRSYLFAPSLFSYYSLPLSDLVKAPPVVSPFLSVLHFLTRFTPRQSSYLISVFSSSSSFTSSLKFSLSRFFVQIASHCFPCFLSQFCFNRPPFQASEPIKIYMKALRGIEAYDLSHQKNISSKAYQFIKKLCRINPTERLGMGRLGIQEVRHQK